MEITGQVLSIIGALLCILSFQIKKNKPYFITQIAAGLCFATSYIFFGALSAALLNAVNVIRCLILTSRKIKKDGIYLIILIFTYALCGLLGILVFDMPDGVNAAVFTVAVILTTLANIAATFSFWTRDGKKIRIVQASIVSPCWIFNNCVVGSIGGTLCEIFNMISIIVSFIRYGFNGFENEKNDIK